MAVGSNRLEAGWERTGGLCSVRRVGRARFVSPAGSYASYNELDESDR